MHVNILQGTRMNLFAIKYGHTGIKMTPESDHADTCTVGEERNRKEHPQL